MMLMMLSQSSAQLEKAMGSKIGNAIKRNKIQFRELQDIHFPLEAAPDAT